MILENPAITAMGGNRAQKRGPLVIVFLAAHHLARWQKVIVFYVEDARGAVGTLEERSDLAEIEGIVAQDRIQHCAAVKRGPRPHPIEKLWQGIRRNRCWADCGELQPRAIQALPHLARQSGSLRPSVAARSRKTRCDTRLIGRV